MTKSGCYHTFDSSSPPWTPTCNTESRDTQLIPKHDGNVIVVVADELTSSPACARREKKLERRMMEPADPPSLAHRTTMATGNTSTFLSASDRLRARQLDRFATRPKPARLPPKAKPTVQEREASKYDSKPGGIFSSTTSQPHSSITPSTTAPLSKSSYAAARDGVVSTTGIQRLNNRTFGYGADNTAISDRGNGSTVDNRLICDSLVSGKKGRSFTVGKVGGGGKIYLRYVANRLCTIANPPAAESMDTA